MPHESIIIIIEELLASLRERQTECVCVCVCVRRGQAGRLD